jgi:hypothetical protein
MSEKNKAVNDTHTMVKMVTSILPLRICMRLSITARTCIGILSVYGLGERLSRRNTEHVDLLPLFSECIRAVFLGTLPIRQCPPRLPNEFSAIRFYLSPVSTAKFRPIEIVCEFCCCSWKRRNTRARYSSDGIRHRDQKVSGRLSIGRFVPGVC